MKINNVSILEELKIHLNSNAEEDINLDMNDFKCIIDNKDSIQISQGEYRGVYSAVKAMQKAIGCKNTFISNDSISAMILFIIHPEYIVYNLSDAVYMLESHLHEDADIIWGTHSDKNLDKDYVKVILVLA